MNLETLFSVAGAIVLPGWFLLVFFPGWRWTTSLITSVVLPAILAVVYLTLMVLNFNDAPEGFSAFNRLEKSPLAAGLDAGAHQIPHGAFILRAPKDRYMPGTRQKTGGENRQQPLSSEQRRISCYTLQRSG